MKERPEDKSIPDMGVACDGDADRHMVLGRRWFVSPGDSAALLASNFKSFLKGPLLGVARSVGTAASLDQVAKAFGIPYYETPVGWKFSANLLDAGKINLIGEEAFGTSSNHIREKDGIWALLAWLSVLSDKNKERPEGEFFGVPQCMEEFWKKFGRNYFLR